MVKPKYDEYLDKSIIRALNADSELSYNEIHRRVNKDYRMVADTVLSYHLQILEQQKKYISGRIIRDKGVRVYYSLTDKARQQYQFGVLEFSPTITKEGKIKKIKGNKFQTEETEESKRKKMYMLLFFIGTVNHPIYLPKSKKEFQDFLSEIGLADIVNEHDDIDIWLKQIPKRSERIILATNTETQLSDTLFLPIDDNVQALPIPSITPPYRLFITLYSVPMHRVTFWKEEYAYFDYSSEYEKEAWRPELEEFRKQIKKKTVKAKNITVEAYRYTVPGISISDLLNKDRSFAFEYIDINQQEAQEAFSLLKENGLLKAEFEFMGETRYSIADESLIEVISACGDVSVTLYDAMTMTWFYIRGPTELERQWLATFFGHKTADHLFRNCYSYRKGDVSSSISLEANKQQDFISYVQQCIKNLKKKATADIKAIRSKYADRIAKYMFPLDDLIEVISPPPPQNLIKAKR